jgi:hypothetical protein
MTAFSSNADQNTDSLSSKVKQFEKEFKQDNYVNLAEFHNIITLCNAIPDSKSFNDWLNKHSNDEDLNIEHMQHQVKECKNISKKGYRQLEKLYRKSLMFNNKESKFILASLIPFTSDEKISLLSDSASWSLDSINMLAMISLREKDTLSNIKRLFWLSISEISSFYPAEYEVAVSELNSLIDSSTLIAINDLIVNWNDASEDMKNDIISNLEEI